MRGLNNREKRLLALCLLTVFAVANLFAARAVSRALGGGKSQIKELENELAENLMWLEDEALWERRRAWLDQTLPPSLARQGVSVGNAQGELMQQLQNDLFERKLRIDRQSLLEPAPAPFYSEVAVNLRVEGDAAEINRWLATLQSPEKFQVIKTLNLELDTRSRAAEPQARCDITVARWFAPPGSDSPALAPDPSGPPAPPVVEPEKLDLTERS